MEINSLLERARNFLFARQQSYRRVFDPESPLVQDVLVDLAKFCRANKSTFHADPRVAAQMDGRREVWLRITQHLNLTQDQLWSIYGKVDK